MTEIPEPQDTGSAGVQEPGTTELVPGSQASPLEGLPIARTIEGLAATRSRSLGGEIGATLLAGSFAQLSHDLNETRQEMRDSQRRLEETRQELSDSRTRAAVLAERVDTAFTGRHLRNLSILVGTALVGIAIELYRNDFNKYAVILGALGALLMLLGWFSTSAGSAE